MREFITTVPRTIWIYLALAIIMVVAMAGLAKAATDFQHEQQCRYQIAVDGVPCSVHA